MFLRCCLAHIDEVDRPIPHLPTSVLGKTDTAGSAIPSKSRGNVDAVAHQVAVALLDHIAEMDADAELDAALGRKSGVALDHPVLHLDGAANGIDNASELNDAPVARCASRRDHYGH